MMAFRRRAGHQLVSVSKVGTRRFCGDTASSKSAYGSLMAMAPLTTSGLSALVLWGAGDLLAQSIDHYLHPAKPKELELSRLAGCMTHGFFIGGVGGYLWYGWMDKFVTKTVRVIPGTKKFIAAKILMEICVWHPVVLLGYWGIVGKFEGHSNAQIGAELRESFLPMLAGDASLWTPIDILNFRYVPVHLQALVFNAGSLVEAVALSYIHGLGGEGDGFCPDKDQPVEPRPRSNTHRNQSEVSASAAKYSVRACVMADAPGLDSTITSLSLSWALIRSLPNTLRLPGSSGNSSSYEVRSGLGQSYMRHTCGAEPSDMEENFDSCHLFHCHQFWIVCT
jgi:protein Mpv17